MRDSCVFCDIVQGTKPAHRIYEDEKYLAFLDIYPSMKGQALVVPKKHLNSYVFALPEEEFTPFMTTARKVARKIDLGLKAVRTCMVIEGMEVDHAHIKLYPLITVASSTSAEVAFSDKYRGYLSTLHGPRADDSELEEMAKVIAETRND